ncbi:MAG: hypothetical protein K2K99_01055, partial [Muribaculaceae bacterium]|nr:hypothetical protein [Muribaculaceae bacterium]
PQILDVLDCLIAALLLLIAVSSLKSISEWVDLAILCGSVCYLVIFAVYKRRVAVATVDKFYRRMAIVCLLFIACEAFRLLQRLSEGVAMAPAAE